MTEQAVTKQKGVEMTIRLDNGQYIDVTQVTDESFVVGDALKVRGSERQLSDSPKLNAPRYEARGC